MARYGIRHQSEAPAAKGSEDLDATTKKIILTARVTPGVRAKAHDMAAALGISVSALLSELVERAELDESGHPGWESKYAQPADEGQEQLEMSA